MSELHPDDRTALARVLGMKPSEIRSAVEVPDSDPVAMIVETHDGQLTRVEADGTTSPWEGPLPGVDDVHVADGDPEDGEQDVEPVIPEGLADGDGDPVPDGNTDVVLTWVGDDAERATRALVAEQAKAKPRATLISQLARLARVE